MQYQKKHSEVLKLSFQPDEVEKFYSELEIKLQLLAIIGLEDKLKKNAEKTIKQF